MTNTAAPNAEMIRLWNENNGTRWAALQERLDAQLDPVGLAAMQRLPLGDGARVLDIGCGCGSTSLELAERVAPHGAVLGVDISAPLLAIAAERAAKGDVTTVSFVRSDAQTHAFDAGSFDAAFSRFGVMFFDDPVAAFSNVRRALVTGGALTFLCWRAPTENEWVRVPIQAVLPLLEPPTPPKPGAPGPFSFAERERVIAVLTAAGFSDVTVDAYDAPLRFGGGGELDAIVDFALQIGPTAALLREQSIEDLTAVRAALRDELAKHQREGGVSLGAAMWIVCARA